MSNDDGVRGYLVECCWPGVTEQAVADAAHRAVQAAAEIRRQGHDVDFLTAILVPADETVFFLFEGQVAAVPAASQRAGVPVERVLVAPNECPVKQSNGRSEERGGERDSSARIEPKAA